MPMIVPHGPFAVPDDYKLMMEFSVGIHGWFVPDAVRKQAWRMIQELVTLRTMDDKEFMGIAAWQSGEIPMLMKYISNQFTILELRIHQLETALEAERQRIDFLQNYPR